MALCSILGSAAGAPVLDPLGGLAVSFFILQQGLSLSRVAALEMLDKGVDAATRDAIVGVVKPLVNKDITQGGLLGVRNVRAVKSGGASRLFLYRVSPVSIVALTRSCVAIGLSSIDLTILVSPDISVRESHDIESQVRERIMSERRDAREVKIHIHGVEPGEMEELRKEKQQGGSDFGRDGC